MGITCVKVTCDRCGKEMTFSSIEEFNLYFRAKEIDNSPKMFLFDDYYAAEPIKLCLGCANRLYNWFENTSYREKERNRKNLHANNETNIEGGTQHEEESIV